MMKGTGISQEYATPWALFKGQFAGRPAGLHQCAGQASGRNAGGFTGPLAAALFGLALAVSGASLPVQAEEAAQGMAAQASVAAAAGVDINRAEAAELAEALVGVGLRKAEAIVRYREQFGPFESVEELAEVKGIGAATLERNRALIRLN